MAPHFRQLIFKEVPNKKITTDGIRMMLNDAGTRTIHLASSHKNILRKNEQGQGGKLMRLPFRDTIELFMKEELGSDIHLFDSKYDQTLYRILYTDEEFNDFARFIEKYKDMVFIRDHLDLSIALSRNFDENNQRTILGILEYQAKYQNDVAAAEALVKICSDTIKNLPYYQHADCICAVPSSQSDQISLPQMIARKMTGLRCKDISHHVSWDREKKQFLKNAVSMEEKLNILESLKLHIAKPEKLLGKHMILLDDLYMSGLTMQYMAMKLKEAGAGRVMGLCIVKSRGNRYFTHE